MIVDGGCYCGAIRYRSTGEPVWKAECFCRECQYITGGNATLAMAVPADEFAIVQGKPSSYTRPDLDHPVTREFCSACGTHLLTRTLSNSDIVILKVGSFDDPALFGEADSANYVCDAQPFHRLPSDRPVFQKWMK